LFSDFEVLLGLLPEHPAVIELAADLHRRLGQWELARLRYGSLAELEPANGAALNNLGVYHIRKQDFRSAKGYLERAGEAEPDLVEPFFNLSQAFSSSYDFGESHQALAQAQKIDRARVDAWLEEGDNDLAIPVEGSARRYGEIRRDLVARGRVDTATTGLEWLRGELTLSVTSALLLAAIALHVLRRRFGYTTRVSGGRRSKHVGARLLRALFPGWHAAEEGLGGRGIGLALLVVGLTSLPLLSRLRYRLPIDGDLGGWPLLVVSLVGLMAFVMVRVGNEFTAGGRR
jgi:tetratricopeptide (TPR) repeat protein